MIREEIWHAGECDWSASYSTGNTEKWKSAPSPSPSAAPDKAKARAAIKDLWRAQEEELKAEKAQIEQGIKASTGPVREQWKSRLAVWRAKMKTAKQDAKVAEAAVK